MTESILKIEGMTCSHCAQHVKKALLTLPGVEDALVDEAFGKAVVRHDRPLDLDRAAAAVEEAGYRLVRG